MFLDDQSYTQFCGLSTFDDKIQGHVGTDLTAPFWQKLNTWTLHTDSTHTHCQFKTAKFGAVSVKTTLAGTETASATNSAAHRETNPLPSGGLELTFNLGLGTQQSFSGSNNCDKVPCSV